MSFYSQGAEAVYHLLKGATFIRIQRGYRLYRKKGKYRDALRDFNAVNPHGVEQSRKVFLPNFDIIVKMGGGRWPSG